MENEINTYQFLMLAHPVEEQYQVMVYLNQYVNHDLKQAMLLVSKFRTQYHQNNAMVKMHRMALDPKYIKIIFNQ